MEDQQKYQQQFRKSNAQNLVDTKPYQVAGQVSKYKLQLPELEKLNLDRYQNVLPLWYARKFRANSKPNEKVDTGFA